MGLGLILGIMFGMIIGSIILELILPQNVKNTAGTIICGIMMGITMLFLAGAAVGLVLVTITQYLMPLFA